MKQQKTQSKRVLYIDDLNLREFNLSLYEALKKSGIPFDIFSHHGINYDTRPLEIHQLQERKVNFLEKIVRLTFSIFEQQVETNLLRTVDREVFGSLPCMRKIRSLLFHGIRKLAPKIFVVNEGKILAAKILGRKKNFDFSKYGVVLYNPSSIKSIEIIVDAILQKIKIVAWIYSWDNLFKSRDIFPLSTDFFVWNAAMAHDLRELYAVEGAIHNVGSSLVSPESIVKSSAKSEFRYLYFCCSCGEGYTSRELEVVILLLRIMKSVVPAYKLVLRPYITRESKALSLKLSKTSPDLILDSSVDTENLSLAQREVNLSVKQALVEQCSAFISFGTTMSLQAAASGRPVYHLIEKQYGLGGFYGLGHRRCGEHLFKYILSVPGAEVFEAEEQSLQKMLLLMKCYADNNTGNRLTRSLRMTICADAEDANTKHLKALKSLLQ